MQQQDNYQPVELFHVAASQPATCPVCNQPIRWVNVRRAMIGRTVAVNPFPVPQSMGSYQQIADDPADVELIAAAAELHGPFYVAHERTCTRCPF